MTFEARDSAAKVVPARLKVGAGTGGAGTGIGTFAAHHPATTAAAAAAAAAAVAAGCPQHRTAGSQTALSQHFHQRSVLVPHAREGLERVLTSFPKTISVSTF